MKLRRSAPATAPMIVPRPPLRATPPMTAAAIAFSVYLQYLATGVLLLAALAVPFLIDRVQAGRRQTLQRSAA